MQVTTILNLYRRPQYMAQQVAAVRKQSVGNGPVWIWKNYHEDNASCKSGDFNEDRFFDNDHNWKYFGRFAAGMLVDTEYVAFFDDDTIPGRDWFLNCMSSMAEKDGIMGSAGVVLNSAEYADHYRVGWPSKNESIERVDLVGHAWFLKTEWLKYMWMEKPPTWNNGEDIHLSHMAQKYGQIETYCPPHPAKDLMKHGSLLPYQYGDDNVASSRQNNWHTFFPERDACVKNALEGGWQTVRGIKCS